MSNKTPKLKLESSLLYRFSVISNRVGDQLYAFYNARYGMSQPAWRVLAHMAELQPMSAKVVARRNAMDSVSVTRALNQLDELGLIIRTIDGEDRRRVVLRLSKKGQEVYDTIAPLAVEAEREIIAELSPSERATLYALTLRIWKSPEAVEPKRNASSARRRLPRR